MRIVKIENIEIKKSRNIKRGREYYIYRINLPASYFRHGLIREGKCTIVIIQRDREDEELPDVIEVR